MSNTKYARDRTLRMTAEQQHALFLAVTTRIELVSSGEIVMVQPDATALHLRTLRSLLERLSD